MDTQTEIVGTGLRVQEISSLERFEELRSAWDDLCRRSIDCFPMLEHAWLCAWWKAFASERIQCKVVLVWEGDALVCGAPITLRKRKRFGVCRRVLCLFANTWVDRAHILLARPSAQIVDELLDYVSSHFRFDLIELFPMEVGSAQTSLLLDCARRRGWKLGTDEHLQSPFLTLPTSWDALMESLSSSFRQTVRRKIRKVAEMPEVTMRIVTDESCIEPIVTISLESWQHDQGTSMASEDRILAFYSAIIRAAARDGTLRCALMEAGGEPAAFEFNLAHRTTLYNFKLGFRKKFSELSTGIVLKAYLLQQTMLHEPHITQYDFMGTSEPYKLNWSKSIRSHNRYYIFPRRFNALLAHWLFFRLRPWMRTRLPGVAQRLKPITHRLLRR